MASRFHGNDVGGTRVGGSVLVVMVRVTWIPASAGMTVRVLGTGGRAGWGVFWLPACAGMTGAGPAPV